MKKTILGVSALTILLAVSFVAAKGNPHDPGITILEGKPFKALQEKIDDLWIAIDDLYDQIASGGTQGPPGPPGDDGEDGEDGADGISCWDLDADYECDSEEDVNQDTECNAQDCQGEQGPQGEQGEPGEDGADGEDGTTLHLYDAGSQDLGILISTNYELSQFQTYLPTLDAVFSFNQRTRAEINSFAVETSNGGQRVFFTDLNCAGTAYLNPNKIPSSIWQLRRTNRFFKVTDDLPADKVITLSSHGNDAGCINNSEEAFRIRAEEISLPFSYPPTGPLYIVEE